MFGFYFGSTSRYFPICKISVNVFGKSYKNDIKIIKQYLTAGTRSNHFLDRCRSDHNNETEGHSRHSTRCADAVWPYWCWDLLFKENI